MKCVKNIHVPQRKNPAAFSDPLTFSSSAALRLTFTVLREIAAKFGKRDIHFPLRMIYAD